MIIFLFQASEDSIASPTRLEQRRLSFPEGEEEVDNIPAILLLTNQQFIEENIGKCFLYIF